MNINQKYSSKNLRNYEWKTCNATLFVKTFLCTRLRTTWCRSAGHIVVVVDVWEVGRKHHSAPTPVKLPWTCGQPPHINPQPFLILSPYYPHLFQYGTVLETSFYLLPYILRMNSLFYSCINLKYSISGDFEKRKRTLVNELKKLQCFNSEIKIY